MTEKLEPWFWGLGWFITATGVLGNALVIYLIATKHHLQRKSNWFLLSLATADLFVGFSYIPPFHACRKMDSCNKVIWSVTRQAIQWLFLYSSVSNLFTMTVDRYIALTSPFKHKRDMTPARIARLVFTAWVIPLITRVFIFIPIYLYNKATALNYLVPVFLFTFELLPCLLLPCFTVHMVYIVRNSQRARRRRVEDSSAELKAPSFRIHFRGDGRTNHVNVVISVVGLFIICYSVDVYTSVCYIFGLSSISTRLWYVRHILLVTNSALNPLAYALFKRDIKQAILDLAGKPPNNQVSPSTAN